MEGIVIAGVAVAKLIHIQHEPRTSGVFLWINYLKTYIWLKEKRENYLLKKYL